MSTEKLYISEAQAADLRSFLNALAEKTSTQLRSLSAMIYGSGEIDLEIRSYSNARISIPLSPPAAKQGRQDLRSLFELPLEEVDHLPSRRYTSEQIAVLPASDVPAFSRLSKCFDPKDYVIGFLENALLVGNGAPFGAILPCQTFRQGDGVKPAYGALASEAVPLAAKYDKTLFFDIHDRYFAFALDWGAIRPRFIESDRVEAFPGWGGMVHDLIRQNAPDDAVAINEPVKSVKQALSFVYAAAPKAVVSYLTDHSGSLFVGADDSGGNRSYARLGALTGNLARTYGAISADDLYSLFSVLDPKSVCRFCIQKRDAPDSADNMFVVQGILPGQRNFAALIPGMKDRYKFPMTIDD